MIKKLPQYDPNSMAVNMFIAYEDLILNPYMTVEQRREEFIRRKAILERVMKDNEITEYPCELRQHKMTLKRFDLFLKDMTSVHLFFQYGNMLVTKTFSKIEDKYARKILEEVRPIAERYRM